MAKNKATDKELEERYESGVYRLTQERNDFVLPQVLEFIKGKQWINLRPEYQRRLVWDKKKRSLFIESLLMNVPIPPVFLFEWEYGRYEVMDGQQRLNAIVDFYENRFKLAGLTEWNDLNGRTYADFPPVIQRGLDRRRISAVVLLAENLAFENAQFNVRRTVFERLNTGGQNLNAQELRNCLYSGRFNELLIELAGHDLFDDIWGIPRYSDNIRGDHISDNLANNTWFKRMRDVEIVLRFFALRNRSAIKGSVKTILDRCMERYGDAERDTIEDLRERFLSRLQTCYDLFGARAFRLDESRKHELSLPLYDAEMVAVDRLYEHRSDLVQKSTQVLQSLDEALTDEDTYELIVARPNTADAIKKRLAKVEEIFRSVI
jgi:hypothetical protein